MRHGIQVFSSLAEAKEAGFEWYDNIPDGHLVRRKIKGDWVMAIVYLTVRV
jgi:asparagine N-glycosylation enzyme membrane subunit Stt3